ncbi:MAG: BON domain-containing protein [Planctomycetota bacterium]|nr:BON domain-containing protein [Planctomycetota bacterium]
MYERQYEQETHGQRRQDRTQNRQSPRTEYEGRSQQQRGGQSNFGPSEGWYGNDYSDEGGHPIGEDVPYYRANRQQQQAEGYRDRQPEYGDMQRVDPRFRRQQFERCSEQGYQGQRARAPYQQNQEGTYGAGGYRRADFGEFGGRFGGDEFSQGRSGQEHSASQFGGQGEYGARDSASRSGVRQRYGKAPKNYKRTEERIREEVCERIMQDSECDASDVDIQVKGNEVSLEGSVPDRWMKRRIEDIAEEVMGVEEVENRIRVKKSGEASGRSAREDQEDQSEGDGATTGGRTSGGKSSDAPTGVAGAVNTGARK